MFYSRRKNGQMSFHSSLVTKKEDLGQYIPHKPPFLLVDELYYYDDEYAISGFAVSHDHVMVRDGFLLEAAIIENMAQTMALKSSFQPGTKHSENDTPRMGYLVAVNRSSFINPVPAGELLITELKVTQNLKTFIMVKGTCSYSEIPVAVCEISLFIE
jgi:predicted hotdog family 3-hydroxylacyl-ACP dehydratase